MEPAAREGGVNPRRELAKNRGSHAAVLSLTVYIERII